MRINYSDGLKFAPLGFVHSQELDTVAGPGKYAQIVQSSACPIRLGPECLPPSGRRILEYGGSVVVQHFSREKNSRKAHGCVSYPIDSERRVISSRSRLSQELTNRNAPSEVED